MTVKAKTKKSSGKPVTFDEYRAIKEDIIEISEQRFENILNRQISKLEEKIDKKIDNLKWYIGIGFIFLSLLITVFKFLLK